MTKHTIVALVEDRPGVLNRIASMFRRRAFNIESLAVGHSEVPRLSRMTVVVDGATTQIDQVTKQLYKLADVVKVSDITEEEMVYRELALIKVWASNHERGEVLQIVELFRANVIDVAPDSLVIEITGTEDKIDAMMLMLKGFGVKEMVRTGRVAMIRGGATISVSEEETAAAPPRRAQAAARRRPVPPQPT